MVLPARLIFFIVTVISLCCSFQPGADAFEPDAHYALTYYLALHVGYTPRQAFQLASATFAIDEDPDTGPMEATAGDAVFGANHPGLTGTKHPRIAGIWSQFHCFAREGEGKMQISESRKRDSDYLWGLALEQGNPGPFLHYTQDLYSHSGWDNIRGHAAGGHVPDFLSNDPHYSGLMTEHTIRVLKDFKRQWLQGEEAIPEEVDMARIREVLKRLIDANPPTWGAPNYIPYEDVGRPSLEAAIRVINEAIKEDRAAGRIHPFAGDFLAPSPTSYSWDLPWRWHQFDFNGKGEVRAPILEAYALERLQASVLAAGVSDRRPQPTDIFSRLQIALELQYEIRNVFDRPPLEGVYVAVKNYQGPDPGGNVDISKLPGRVETQRLKNGDQKVTTAFSLTKEDFQKGNQVWICALQVEGRKPIITKVNLPCQKLSGAPAPESEKLIQKYYDDAQTLTPRSPCRQVEDAIEAIKKIAELDACLNNADTLAKLQGLDAILARSKADGESLIAAVGSGRNYTKKCDATSATSMIAQAQQILSRMACRLPDQPSESDVEALEGARNKVTSDRQSLLNAIDGLVANAEDGASRCDMFDVKSAADKLDALLKAYAANCSTAPSEGTAAVAKIQQLLTADENKEAAQKAIAEGKDALKRCDVLGANASADELEFLGKVCGLDTAAEAQSLRTAADGIAKTTQALQENAKSTLDIARTAWQSCDVAKVKWAASEMNRIVDPFTRICPEYPEGVSSDVDEIQKLLKSGEDLGAAETEIQEAYRKGEAALKKCDPASAKTSFDEAVKIYNDKVNNNKCPSATVVQKARQGAQKSDELNTSLQIMVNAIDSAGDLLDGCPANFTPIGQKLQGAEFQMSQIEKSGATCDFSEERTLIAAIRSDMKTLETTRAQINAKLTMARAFIDAKNFNEAARQRAIQGLDQADALLKNAEPEDCYSDLDFESTALRGDLDLLVGDDVEDIPDDGDDFGDGDPGDQDSGADDSIDVEDIPDDLPVGGTEQPQQDDPKLQQPAGGPRWVLQQVVIIPEKPPQGWSYSSGSANFTVYTGDKAQFQWTTPPQTIDSNGFQMSVSVQSMPLPNSRLAALIGFSTSGFESDNSSSEEKNAYAKAENSAASDQKSMMLRPRSSSTELEVKVGFMWAISFTYTYRLAQ